MWKCPACGEMKKIEKNGVRCSGAGHNIYLSVEYINGYTYKDKQNEQKQLKLF